MNPFHCRFIPANLENIFSKYACTVPDKLTFKELWHMTDATRNAMDFFGWYFLSLMYYRRKWLDLRSGIRITYNSNYCLFKK